MIKIKDFPNYSIDEHGNVRSDKSGRILKPRVHTRNYLFVELRKDGKGYQKLVHRLVAEAFILNPNNYPNVCHRDNNKRNPHKDNLFWGNQTMNGQHYFLCKSGIDSVNAAESIILNNRPLTKLVDR